MQKIGFLGLGIMGRPMAENLARDFEVLGFDPQQSRLIGLQRVKAASSAADVARQCSVVCLSLPTAEVVREVALGQHGLGNSLGPGSLVIDLSTGIPSISREVAERLARNQIDFVDAPVSGGEAGAIAATLAIMVGGSPPVVERARAYLSRIGGSVIRVGDVGAGCVAKLVNNMIVGAAFTTIAESFALARANGVDARDLYEAVKGGWAGSKVLDVSAKAICERDYTPGGTIDMLEKDLSYARQLAAQSKVPIPMSALAHEIFVAGQAAGSGRRSQPALYELWRILGEAASDQNSLK
ncbi:MAG TPA: NAD(P)-binding domain-containing protein [Spirochaetia bacterium]|nr:NAD(P)-binding domain-containing protein [Spirochaetia bacterium]